MHILIVEDDRSTARLLADALDAQGWSTASEADGDDALLAAQRGTFDAMVLDIMLPTRDGLSVVRSLRECGNKLPVLMLSARGDIEQRVAGLNAGADDYLAKPYAQSELVARLRSITRRSSDGPEILSLSDLTYNVATHEARRGGTRIELSARECRLLECLLCANGAVVSRRDIIAAVWGYDFDPGTNIVNVYVRRLRLKVEPDASRALIHSVRGLGYMMRELS